MVSVLTTKGFDPDVYLTGKIEKELRKIDKLVPHMMPDLKLNVFTRKSQSGFHPRKKNQHHKEYLTSRLKKSNYEGWVSLTLPKEVLFAKFKGLSADDGINSAIKKLLKELKKYKDLHFKSQSQHPHHETIRESRESGRYYDKMGVQ